MTLTAEQILKEAELTLQKETVDNKLTMEKRASDALVNEILEQRKKTGLDKKAEVIAIENSNPSTIINPEESKIKSFEKIALDLTGIKGIAGNLGKNFMENKGARNAAIGAVAGGALGAATGKDGEKGSSAVKGALLGGSIGAAGSLIKPDAIKAMGNQFKPAAKATETAEDAIKPSTSIKDLFKQKAKRVVTKVKKFDFTKGEGLGKDFNKTHGYDK